MDLLRAEAATPGRIAVAALAAIPVSLFLYLKLRTKPTSEAWIARRQLQAANTCTASLHDEPPRISLPSGRRLAYSIYGSPSATRTVLFLHGLPGSRLPPIRDLVETSSGSATLKLKDVRVVCVDRPGYGYSTHDPERTPASFARDLDALLTALDEKEGKAVTTAERPMMKVDVVGYSLGGPHALAFATLFPNRVNKLTLLSPSGFVAPPADAVDGISPVNLGAHRLVGNGLGFLLKFVWNVGASIMCDPEAYFTGQMIPALGEADRKLFEADPTSVALWESSTGEAFRSGIDGPLRDILTLFGVKHGTEAEKWGFQVRGIDVPTKFVWGDNDNLVSRKQVEYLYECLSKDSKAEHEMVILPGLGHFGILAMEHWLGV